MVVLEIDVKLRVVFLFAFSIYHAMNLKTLFLPVLHRQKESHLVPIQIYVG